MNFEQLKAGIKNVKTVPMYQAALRMRILSEAELERCRAESSSFCAETGLDDDASVIDQVIRQLFLALDDGEGNRLAASVPEFKKVLTRAEREFLTNEYLAFEKECSPRLDGLSATEFEGVVADLKKNPGSFLNASNGNLLRRLARYLESQPSS